MDIRLKNNSSAKEVGITIRNDGYVLVDNTGSVVARLTKNDDAAPFEVLATDRAEFDETDENLMKILDILGRKFYNDVYIGVEDSEGEENPILDGEPFRPEQISIDQKRIAMDVIIRRFEQGTLCLDPDFQRKEVWSDERKSRLIESLLLKIPIPMFYVSSNEDGDWTIVDGLQRLSTIRDFVLGREYLADKINNADKKGCGLHLIGLEFWTNLEGVTMNDLPTNLYNRLCETELSFTIINPGTPEEVKRNIFKRINTGGIPLSSQEIRNALYGGKSTELLNELVEMPIFKKATGYSIKTERMEDKELVLRFVSFLIRNRLTYNKTVTTDEWLSDTMIILNALPALKTRECMKLLARKKIPIDQIQILPNEVIVSQFGKAMNRSIELFGNSAFRKSIPGYRRAPINKALFETWGVLLLEMSEEKFQKFLRKKKEMYIDYEELLHNGKFIVAISRDSTRVSSVQYRYSQIESLISKYSND